uniref:hypothetical protein n=1 Tax=Sphingomonas sp. TaxID=28214 RepID=UPI003B3AED54
MAGPDDLAKAALRSYSAPVIPIYCGFLDILGDPIRVTTAPYSIDFSGTGDEDLDGFRFSAVDPELISISTITMKEGGADTVTCTLSGLIGVDGQLLNQIGNKANWQGRVARLWQLQINEALQQVGAVWPWFTGYMTVPKIIGDATQQIIQLDIESYLAFIRQASGRTYLSQAEFDPGDQSAAASI